MDEPGGEDRPRREPEVELRDGSGRAGQEVPEDPHQDYVDQPGSEPPPPGGDPNLPNLAISAVHPITSQTVSGRIIWVFGGGGAFRAPPEAAAPLAIPSPSVDPLVVHPRAVEPVFVPVLILEEYVVVPGVGLVGLVLLPRLLAAALAGE